MPDKSLGTLGNSLAGVARGGIVGVILQAIAPALQGGEGAGSIIGSIVGGGAGGSLLMAIVSLIKNRFAVRM